MALLLSDSVLLENDTYQQVEKTYAATITAPQHDRDVNYQMPMKRFTGEGWKVRTILRFDNIGSGRFLQVREMRTRQLRLFLWFVLLGMSGMLLLLWHYLGECQRTQKELIPISRMIVRYQRRADGKKNGIFTS